MWLIEIFVNEYCNIIYYIRGFVDMKAVFFDVDGTLIEGTHPDYRYMRENV